MKDLGLRSPSGKTGEIVHFGRMLDKIRAHARDELPADYQPKPKKSVNATSAGNSVSAMLDAPLVQPAISLG